MSRFNAGDKAIFVRDIYFEGESKVAGFNSRRTRFYMKDGSGFEDIDAYPTEAEVTILRPVPSCNEDWVEICGHQQMVTRSRLLTEQEYEERFGHKFGKKPVEPKRLGLDFVVSVLNHAKTQQVGYVERTYKEVIDFLEEHAEEW